MSHVRGTLETLHLLKSPVNAARLLRAIADADAGRLTEFDPTNEIAKAIKELPEEQH